MIEGAAINVLDYGADPTGTNDSSAAFQSALDYLETNGGCLYIPAGTYALNTSLTITGASNFSITGAGKFVTTLVRNADTGTLITLANCTDYTISNLSIDCKFSTYATNASHGIAFYNSSNALFENLYIEDWKNSAILGYASPAGPSSYTNNTLQNVTVDGKDTANNGLLLVDLNESGYINCQASNINKLGSPGYALQFKENCKNCFIIGGSALSAAIGVAIGNTGASGDNGKNCRVIGTYIYNCDVGIAFGNTSGHVVDSCLIDNNNSATSGAAIDTQLDSYGISAKNISVKNLYSGKQAVRIRSGSTDNVFNISSIENVITGTVTAAVTFESGALRNTVTLDLFANPTTVDSTTTLVSNSGGPTNTFKYNYIPQLNTLTIASGVISLLDYAVQYVRVDTEGAAATDDLDTINNGTDRQTIILQSASNVRNVVVKNNTGNIILAAATDFTLDTVNDTITLMYNSASSKWCEVGRSAN